LHANKYGGSLQEYVNNTLVKINTHMHYMQNPIKLAKSLKKRKNTILQKYGECGISAVHKNTAVEFYEKEKQKINNCSLVEKHEVTNFITNNYDSYRGRAGNRKLKRDNLQVYKSLIHYTNDFSNFYSRSIPFVCRMDIAINNFVVDEDMLCICGSKFTFDPQTQDWTKLYCMGCRLVGTTKPHFINKFGADGERKFREHNIKGCITRGKNEKDILDKIEMDNNISIQRDFKVLNFFPDGYCSETNTVYEVNEPHHRKKYYKEKDEKRRKILHKYLKCKFIVIWDDTLQIETHEL
jgi:hypothetical protein